MFKYGRKKQDDPAPPQPPPKDDAYKPLDEIEVARDFRTSLILTQFNHDSDLAIPQNDDPDRLSALPMPPMPWMAAPADSTRSIKPQPTTPPLSPTSSTSDTLVRKSSSTRSSNDPQWRPLLMSGGRNKGDEDFQDIATGPPIIPRSKTPPPIVPLVQVSALDKEKNKTIFDSDEEESDNDLFFQDFSATRPKSKRISKPKKIPSDAKRISKFDLAAFANHLHENRLSMMQLRQTVHLTEEDERELMNLLEKRKSMANADPMPTALEPPLPTRPVVKKPSFLLQKFSRTHATATESQDEIAPQPSSSTSRLHEQERKRRVRKSMSMDEIHRMAITQDEKTQVSEAPTVEPIEEDSSEKKTLTSSISSPSLSPWSLHKSGSTRKPPSHTKKENPEKPTSTRSSTPGQKAIGLFGSLRQASRSHQPFRGLVRNLSSAGSYYRGRHSTASTVSTESGVMSRAAMAVMEHQKKEDTSNTKHHTTSNTKSTLSTMTTMPQEEPDNGGNLITHLLAKASKSRRTTKTVNMNHEDTKSTRREKTKSRVVRRTIIYVPPDSINFMKTLKQNDSAGLRSKKNTAHAPPLPADMLEKMRQLQKSTTPTKTPRRSVDNNSNKAEESSANNDDSDDLGSVLNYYDDDSLYDYYQNRESGVPHLEGLEVREMSDGTVEWGIVKKQGNRKSFFVQDNKRTVEEEEEEDEEKIEEQVLALMGLSVPHDKHHPSGTPPPVPRRSPRRRIDSAEQQMLQQQQQQQQDNRRAKHISTIHSRKDASTTDVYFAPQQTLPSLLQMIADSAQEEEEQGKRRKQASVEEQLDEMMRSFQPPVEHTKF
ncbi:hypothetical protein BJV82DRAFT_93968 [Fennellomyces sp. T-0311]|nr:hypothetical protein BJV82DRAFT_93968 [Fennellomyces sp. T-0311]